MNREEFIESLQDKGFYDVDIDAEKVNDYFERKDFEGSEPRIVGSMRSEDIAVLVWLDRADDEVTPGIHLDFLEPTEERNEYAEFLPTDEKKENPFFYNGSYEFRNIEQCDDLQKLASFVDVTAKAWILEREEYKLWNLKSDIRDDVNLLRNRWSQGHEFPSRPTGGVGLVASDDGRQTFGVFRDERHTGKLSFDIGIKNVRRNINGREKNCDLVYTNGKLFIKTAPDGYSPFTGRSEGVEMFKPHVSDIKLFCEEFKAFHEDVQKFNESIVAKEMLLAADAVLMDLAKAADRGEKAGLTFEKALEKRGIDKEDFMEQVKKAGKSREVIEGASIAGGAVRLESQQDRKDAAKVLSGWMKKPGKKIAKEIEMLQKKNRAQGR